MIIVEDSQKKEDLDQSISSFMGYQNGGYFLFVPAIPTLHTITLSLHYMIPPYVWRESDGKFQMFRVVVVLEINENASLDPKFALLF